MMYSYSWLTLVLISLIVSLLAFIWGLQDGQFSDQARVRFLPLRDQQTPLPPGNPAKLTVEVYVLLGIIGCGLLALLSPIIITLFQ